MDGIAAATRPDGRIEVFATARAGTIQHFIEGASTPAFSSDYPFPVGAGGAPTITDAASAPTVTQNADGRLEFFYRESSTGRVMTYYTTSSGSWADPVLLRIVRAECMERNQRDFADSAQRCVPASMDDPGWILIEYLSAATDSLGRDVVMVKGLDGKLYITRTT